MRKPRVLIIDDSKLVRKWCSAALIKYGIVVETCINGKEGLKKVLDFHPDVVLTDLEMPVMDGMAVISALKQDEETSHIPIIAFTASNDLKSKIKVLEAGANDFLSKETDQAELVARVKSQFRIKLLEDGLIHERNKFFNILNDLSEAIVILDYGGRIIFLNNSTRSMLGAPNLKTEEGDLDSLLVNVERKEELLRALKAGKLENFEMSAVKDEVRRDFIVNAGPVFLPEQKKHGWALILRDITQEKQMEAMKAEFYSMIVHDLRSPITVINGYIKLILSGKTGVLTGTQREFLTGARERANAMLKLVDEFLTVSKFDASFVNLDIRETDLVEVVKKSVDDMNFIAGDKQVKISFEQIGEVPLISADPDKLGKVFGNLIDNAVKYTMGGGAVKVRVSAGKEKARVAVEDSGIGIDAGEIAHVFDRYRRMSTAKKRKIKGTGLGLAIVKEIIEAHSGKVWVESRAGKGSTFFVEIPLNKTNSEIQNLKDPGSRKRFLQKVD